MSIIEEDIHKQLIEIVQETIDMDIEESKDESSPIQEQQEDEEDVSFEPRPRRSRFRVKRVTLSWHNIVVTEKIRKRKCNLLCQKRHFTNPKKLLNDVCGEVRPGELLAVMGSSGAGKTTLMNVLTGRNLELLKVRGRVLVNGKNINTKAKKLMCYVEQEDMFIGTLTVREHLVYQALLRMDRNLTRLQKLERVDEVLDELRLGDCSNTIIGIPGRIKGASGGEKKRLAFASELLTNPSLFFCDEPTSGLDSYMAQSLVAVLRDLVLTGRTVLCTIHQPSSEVYSMFNNFLFLSNGRVAFMGSAEDSVAFFTSVNLICPPHQNPADFYIHKLSARRDVDESVPDETTEICNAYRQSEYAKQFSSVPSYDVQSDVGSIVIRRTNITKAYQTWVLFKRASRSLKREPILTTARLTQATVVAIILAMCFWQQKLNQNGVTNMNGAMFIMLMNMTVQNGFAVMTTFCVEVPVFAREYSTGLYSMVPFYIGKTMAELPVFVMVPIVYSTILYWSVGLRPDAMAFLYFLIVSIFVANTGCSFGYMISCMTSSPSMAVTLAPPLFVPVMIFGGFFLNARTVPNYLIWLKYMSWFNYAYPILVRNQWTGVKNIECERPNVTNCVTTGEQIIDNFHFEEESVAFNFGMLVVLFLFYRLLACLVLCAKMKAKF